MSASESEVAARSAVQPRARSNPALAVGRILALVAWTSYTYVRYWLGLLLRRPDTSVLDLRYEGTNRWLWGCARIAGFDVRTAGAIPDAPVLLTPNHTGYADVIALGSLFPVFFVAKVEVESWPLMGSVFKISSQIGMSRRGAVGLKDTTRTIAQRLTGGYRVCVFLEGTSTGGDRILPFRSPLVQSAIDANIKIVPVTLRWFATRDGISVDEDVAYWKDHTMAAHLWRLLGLRGIGVEIAFGDAVETDGRDRKALAALLEERVRDALKVGLP